MPLKDKYLKYIPEITLEIFTLICNKLIECGVNPNHKESIETKYNDFSGVENYLQLSGDGKCFDCYREDYGLIETTVQEILGYNPFKDDFVLPEKWCIKNSTDKQLLEFFENYNHGGYNGSSQQILHYPRISGNCLYPSAQKGYTEITFEQFKTYVLKEPIEQPKSIEKWSVGSYIVFLQDEVLTRSGRVTKGKPYVLTESGRCPYFKDDNINQINFDSNASESYGLKWFATLQEAEEFAKTLVEPVKEEVKQPLKQAVHCKTQEEWDFVCDKIGYKFSTRFELNYNDTINVNSNSCECKRFYDNANYNLLSFQEWCDLNGYKMGEEVKFEAGNWYEVKYLRDNSNYYLKYTNNKYEFGYSEYIIKSSGNHSIYHSGNDLNVMSKPILASLEEIQQYLPDGHPDKIKTNQEFKVGEYIILENAGGWSYSSCNNGCLGLITKIGDFIASTVNNCTYSVTGKILNSNNNDKTFKDIPVGIYEGRVIVRHATPEEINNHLISIGQTTDLGEQEPEKYSFKPLRPGDLEWEIQVPQIKTHGIMWCEPAPMTKDNWKHKMILSIDDEELPMVNIIKTNSIKQLLNND